MKYKVIVNPYLTAPKTINVKVRDGDTIKTVSFRVDKTFKQDLIVEEFACAGLENVEFIVSNLSLKSTYENAGFQTRLMYSKPCCGGGVNIQLVVKALRLIPIK